MRKPIIWQIPLWIVLAWMIGIYVLTGTAYAADRKTRTITFLASATRTAATAQSTGFSVGAYTEAQILIDVTAESGTSTLDVTIESSDDNSSYYTHTRCRRITATGRYKQAIANLGKYVRINYTVAGTNFTFKVTGVFKN